MIATEGKPDLSHLPNKPGVYLHKNSTGEIIYVGKAKNLKQRVNQYWQKSTHQSSFKTALLAAESIQVDYIETLSEVDALFLESELIKRYQPKFNIELKDDKSATYVRISLQDPIPNVSFTRIPSQDGATYIGPFYSAGPVYQAMRTLRRVFPYSTHKQIPKKACIDCQMNLCPGPETDQFNIKKYRSNLKKLIQVLKGERSSVAAKLTSQMNLAAKAQNFERAALLRNKLNVLNRLSRIQLKDSEVIGADQALTDLQKLLGLSQKPTHIEGFDISHMSGKDVVASQVVFKNGASSKVDYRNYKISVQQNNDFESMADVISRRLSQKNIKDWGLPNLILIDGGKGQLQSAQSAQTSQNQQIAMFGLAKQFEQLIVLKDDPSIKLNLTFGAQSNRIISSEGSFWVVSFNKKDPIRMLLERIRNEAHRFAVRYHTSLKGKSVKSSELTNITGIGSKTAQKLIISFGSVARVKQASAQQLASVVGNITAKKIYQQLHKNEV
jgi:excinuclease ABC subunit C